MIDYIIYTIISLGCSFFVYYFVLKNQKTFQFNRFFLLISLLLCLVAPVIEIDFFNVIPSITEVSFQPLDTQIILEEVIEGARVEKEYSNPLNLLNTIFWYSYLIISLGFFFRFFINLIRIIKLTRKGHSRLGTLKLIKTTDEKNVASFFNYLFINPERLKDNQYSKSVLQHESIHSNQLHTLDILLIELLLCVFWFNPFIWLYRKAMLQNHEFIADNNTVQSGIDIENYSNAIINLGHMEHRVPLTSGFNFIQIKNRIIMLHQSKSSVLKRTMKISTALLLLVGVVLFSSFKDIKKPLVVVIDAGHGGKDPGNLNEKDIVLNISKKLSKLSDDKIKIITVRDDDDFLSLRDRVKFINAQNADVMISLHCDTSEKITKRGVEVLYDDSNKNNKASLGYGLLLMNQQLENKVVDKGGMKTASFYMLKNVLCPSVFIELGFLSNETDNSRLNDAKHQQDIAKALYDGLLEIRDKKELISILNKE
ncbi:N-acetylmuramoyl-L-alanine amidase [Lacinutrix jangbogonensis]|uniref:N-acetylmuramoyl-L-alanine amidase n=1 Tax=Lacinutrix jangbogonensis TaxID=1469557 RepID=UPI00053F1C02|nr:N-acetylmuramoyl-L-alanine amidase [Lacinutrix jangbogonensis]